MAAVPKVGDRHSYDGAICTVRYVGDVTGTSGSWLGVEWDDPGRGKHDGSHKGVRYFTCQSRSPTAASFVRPSRPVAAPLSFVAAVQEKYASELSSTSAIKFSGKVAEEVGFNKIRRKQAQLSELKVVILDGMRLDSTYGKGEASIAEACPKVIELDLSRNLFRSIGTVVAVCSELPSLRRLRLNGNRFRGVLEDEGLHRASTAFRNVHDLALEETLMSWVEICHIATKFEALAGLSASTNQLSFLPDTPLSTLSASLVSLNLEFNDFASLSDMASLAGLGSLRNLHLKGNRISVIKSDSLDPTPIFSKTLQYLDISYNDIATWSFIDDLPLSFPGLLSLRFAHNPIYDNPDPEHSSKQSKSLTEEAYIFTVGRLANLKTLNFGTISVNDRQDAEMFYLARIGKQLAAVSETDESQVIKGHRRYAELCELYGVPAVNRRKEINPAFLEARLVSVCFIFHAPDDAQDGGDGGQMIERNTRIPKSFDIYAVKGIAGKLFGIKPLSLRLVWETGEWDPVGGFDEEVEDSSDEEGENGNEAEMETENRTSYLAVETGLDDSQSHDGGGNDGGGKPGKWIKREVELQDGPRQLGFCVDGLEVTVRVEIR